MTNLEWVLLALTIGAPPAGWALGFRQGATWIVTQLETEFGEDEHGKNERREQRER